MRLWLTLALLLAFLSVPLAARGADVLPRLAPDTRYAAIRAGMIAQGFEPARVLKRSGNSPVGCGLYKPDICTRWPEILHCSEGPSFCEFLFFRKRDGARAIVVTVGDYYERGCYCLSEVRWADERDFWIYDDMVVAQTAADRLPHYEKNAPYDRVRADLIRHGMRPVHILKHPEGSGVYCHVEPEACRRYPERYVCAMTACRFLFERLSDGALFSLAALGESAGPFYFTVLEPLDAFDLKDLRAEYVIARPAPRALRRSP